MCKNANIPMEAGPKERQYKRLMSKAEVESFLGRYNLDTLEGSRDAAMVSMVLCTGVSAQELARMEVGDLRQEVDGYRHQ